MVKWFFSQKKTRRRLQSTSQITMFGAVLKKGSDVIYWPLERLPLVDVRDCIRSTTFTIIMRWFLIQIAYNNGNVVQTDKVAQTNGGD